MNVYHMARRIFEIGFVEAIESKGNYPEILKYMM